MSSDPKNPFSPDSRNQIDSPPGSSQSTNPFHNTESLQQPPSAAIRKVNLATSHYNYSMPTSATSPVSPPSAFFPPNTQYPSQPANSVYDPSAAAGYPQTMNQSSFANEPFRQNAEGTSNSGGTLANIQQQNQAFDTTQPKHRPTSAQIYEDISRKQRRISFAINQSEEINLSNPNVNFANGPGFLSNPHKDTPGFQPDSSAPAPADVDSNVMKRHRWGTQRHKKGRPRNELKRNKSMFSTHSKKRASSLSINDADSVAPGFDDASLETDANEVYKVYFNMKLPESMIDPETHLPLTIHPRNKIRTTKYTPLSFLPKNLFYQFQNIANIYFLFIVILGVCIYLSGFNNVALAR